jgi:hypothetical protein
VTALDILQTNRDPGRDERTLARIGIMQALNRHQVREFNSDRKPQPLGEAQAGARSMTPPRAIVFVLRFQN